MTNPMKTVLLIEDDNDVRETTADILELANFKVVQADGGKQGVIRAKNEDPDIIICDIMMPEMDGYEVLYMLGKDPRTASIPFIFLTAKAEKSEVRYGMNLGADDYITKPFEEMDLLKAVEIRLDRSEKLRKTSSGNLQELNQFVNEARGLEELKALSREFRARVYQPKEILYHEGDYPHDLIFINSGKVKTGKMNEQGKEYVSGIHSRGDFLGHVPILKNIQYQDFAVVLETAEIVRIPRKDFQTLVHRNPEVSAHFIKLLSGDILENQEKLLSLAFDSVRKRTAETLLELRDRFATEEDTNPVIDMYRNDLAGIVGTAKETLVRTLSDFNKSGWVKVKGKKITILEEGELRRIQG